MKPHIETGIYQHYKGNLYHVLELGRHSETLEPYVVYRGLYGSYGLWIRPLDSFLEKVDVEGTLKPRFTFLHSCTIPVPDPNH